MGEASAGERSGRGGLGKISVVSAIAREVIVGTQIVSDHNSYQKTDRGMQCVPVFLKLETDCFIFPDKL